MQNVTREEFYRKFGDSKNRPRFAPKPSRGTLMAQRNKRVAISEGAMRRRKVVFRYRKRSGQIKLYKVEPYSYRFRKLKEGIRKVLFAYHHDPANKRNRSIKSFVLRDIKNVKITGEPFRPRYKVEM